MAERSPSSSEVLLSGNRITQIREMLSKAARMRRTDSTGDLMPNAVAKEVRSFYSSLKTKEEKLSFFLVLERDLGVDHEEVIRATGSLVNAQKNGVAAILRAEEGLRQTLEPAHIQLLSQISKLPGGVKNIVDMRCDLLEGLSDIKDPVPRQELQALSSSVKNLLVQWFAVGLLDLRRITWDSPASILEKKNGVAAILRAEEVLRQTLEPAHIQLLSQISKLPGGVKNIVDMRCDLLEGLSDMKDPVPRQELQALSSSVKNLLVQWFAVGLLDLRRITWDSPASILEKVILSEPEVDRDEYVYELEKRTTAVFYSITSTQKGLSGVDLGNFLIKHVVQELQHEFPNIEQYATLSPIPGLRQWLKLQINNALEQEGLSGVDLGNFLIKHVVQELQHEFPNIEQYATLSPIPGLRQWLKPQINNALEQEEKGVPQMVLLEDEVKQIIEINQRTVKSPLASFKDILETTDWYQNSLMADGLKKPLLRLCARFEDRNFHIRNGACMWRLNWLADLSARGMDNSFGIMVNYKYVLEEVDKNNQQYLLNGTVTASPQFLELLR
ncbi:PREDICTED: malonyl-CoA decarboxylase, mitochondrial-like [Acropora digitifera]|uniref:malonyl-CoA decarboxylase, mitochondrial-like n=1 Tax=Acropora digitifera TaxID=70779 RepID=UPI00077A82CC|nr:PREDICTED: malonyl-CoA decarboxylase, mitochondrial-like [Acropora digitifera]